MAKLMSELIAIEYAPRVHQNARNLVYLKHVVMKCEESEEIALIAECILDVDTDAGHKSVESTAVGPDCPLYLEHGLNAD